MPSHTARWLRLALALPIVAAASACMRNPEAEAKQQELNIQLGDAVNQLQGEHADLRATIDSLRYVIAKQDTTIQRMAAVTGVPIAK